MSMQMDAEIKLEKIGTLFVSVGSLEGGFGRWGSPQGCPLQKVDTLPPNKTSRTAPNYFFGGGGAVTYYS